MPVSHEVSASRVTSPLVPSPRMRESPIRVAVVAERLLVGETVRVALVGRGFVVHHIPCPRGREELAWAQVELRNAGISVGLLLTELEDVAHVQDAAAVIRQIPASWVVLTGSPAETVWGGVLSAGARGVLPMSATVDELARAVSTVFHGGSVMGEGERSSAEHAWEVDVAERARLVERVAQLTKRELAILTLLNDGVAVADIADLAQVSEGTVRSQVKAVLRKLGVSSQLAAIAAYRHAVEQRL